MLKIKCIIIRRAVGYKFTKRPGDSELDALFVCLFDLICMKITMDLI